MAFLEILQGAAAAFEAYKAIDENGAWLKKKGYRIYRRLTNGKVSVPIFGAGGAGKSTLGRMLVTRNVFSLPSVYTESRLVENNEMNGWVPAAVKAAPGQYARVQNTWPDLIRDLNNGTCVGLINVVSYGYHAVEVPSMKQLEYYGKSGDQEADFEAYTANRRNRELELLQYLFEATSTAKKPFWMITVVSKQDLWAHRFDEVKAHYENGAYAEILGRFASRQGSAQFHHEFFNCSFTLGNFVTEREGVLARNNSGYDLASHVSSLVPLFTTLDQLLSAGNKK